MLTLGVAMLVLAWIFILGIIVGRGYFPEQLLFSTQEEKPAQEGKIVAEGTAAEEIAEEQILSAKDLSFHEALQLGWDSSPYEAQEESAQAVPLPAPEQDRLQDPAAEPDEDQEEKEFEFTFQVAAFQKQDQAELLQERLGAEDIQAFIQSVDKAENRWYRVYVSFAGTEKQSRQFKRQLQKIGVEQPLIRSKEPL